MRIIAGSWRGRSLDRPPRESTRPTKDRVRQAVFNMLDGAFHIPWHQIWALDMFAGSGAYGLEALSRGAQGAIFMERDPLALKTLKSNVTRFAPSRDRFLIREGEGSILLKMRPLQPCGVIFLDPPYAYREWDELFQNLMDHGWCAPNTIIVVEQDVAAGLKSSLFEKQKEKTYGRTKILMGRLI